MIFLNHLLSGNVDKRWRRIVATEYAKAFVESSARVLDVACGTGDLSLTLFETREQELLGLISAGRCWISLPVRRPVAYA
jgi:ubiquinone/menaquinone biosynthesis C-methylase UbiE